MLDLHDYLQAPRKKTQLLISKLFNLFIIYPYQRSSPIYAEVAEPGQLNLRFNTQNLWFRPNVYD